MRRFRSRWTKPQPQKLTRSRTWSRRPQRSRMLQRSRLNPNGTDRLGISASSANETGCAAPVEEAPAKSELLSYGETPSHGAPSRATVKRPRQRSGEHGASRRIGIEAALFSYMSGQTDEIALPAEQPALKRARLFC